MGDIISRIKVNKKYLIDLDANLKKAVDLLNKNIVFINGSFKQILDIKENEIDVLILVNWIHNVEKDMIISEINKILENKRIKYIILDEINENINGYKFKHNFENSFDGYFTYKLIDDPEGIRKFRILKCKK